MFKKKVSVCVCQSLQYSLFVQLSRCLFVSCLSRLVVLLLSLKRNTSPGQLKEDITFEHLNIFRSNFKSSLKWCNQVKQHRKTVVHFIASKARQAVISTVTSTVQCDNLSIWL